MGRPQDILDDVHSKCTEGVSKCTDLGKRACNSIQDCWGFAIHEGGGVQIYNSKASNPSLCTGKHGLKPGKKAWTTFKKAACNGNGKCINGICSSTLIGEPIVSDLNIF